MHRAQEPDDEHTDRGRMLLRKEQEAHAKGMPVGSSLGLNGAGGEVSRLRRA